MVNPHLVRQVAGVYALLERVYPWGYTLELDVYPATRTLWSRKPWRVAGSTVLRATGARGADSPPYIQAESKGEGLAGLSRVFARMRFCALWRLYQRGAVSKPPRQSKAAA
jgi:hypothetical protein